MIIFPLSIPGKIVLILVAIFIGLIWSMLQWPSKWHWLFAKLRNEDKSTQTRQVTATQDTKPAKATNGKRPVPKR